jgi:hypothetical protein
LPWEVSKLDLGDFTGQHDQVVGYFHTEEEAERYANAMRAALHGGEENKWTFTASETPGADSSRSTPGNGGVSTPVAGKDKSDRAPGPAYKPPSDAGARPPQTPPARQSYPSEPAGRTGVRTGSGTTGTVPTKAPSPGRVGGTPNSRRERNLPVDQAWRYYRTLQTARKLAELPDTIERKIKQAREDPPVAVNEIRKILVDQEIQYLETLMENTGDPGLQKLLQDQIRTVREANDPSRFKNDAVDALTGRVRDRLRPGAGGSGGPSATERMPNPGGAVLPPRPGSGGGTTGQDLPRPSADSRLPWRVTRGGGDTLVGYFPTREAAQRYADAMNNGPGPAGGAFKVSETPGDGRGSPSANGPGPKQP